MRFVPILALGLVLVGTSSVPAHAACPTDVVFGCDLTGSSAGTGWTVENSGNSGTAIQAIASGASGSPIGLYAEATAGSGTTYGVSGYTTSSSGTGVYGNGGTGVAGVGGTNGVLGTGGTNGIYGTTSVSNGNGAVAVASTGASAYGVWGISSSGYAGYFSGNAVVTGDLSVSGTLSKGAGAFKIDHPLDPANKYLVHSFVESPDMMNVYNGLITLGGDGTAVVQLPHWFEALNKDFRYQLTPVGGACSSLYIAAKVSGNQFTISGNCPGTEVSWQATGIRKDPYAEQHRLVVEQDKPAGERGYYLHPAEYGMPLSQGVESVRLRAKGGLPTEGATARATHVRPKR